MSEVGQRKQASDPSAALGAAFVNSGLVQFERKRREWLGGRGRPPKREVVARAVDVEDVIERIFSPGGSGELTEPVPLGQMIDILIDVWESDGLYD